MDNEIKIDGSCPLLQVYDMPAALKFYRDILGFTIVNSSKEGTDDVDWIWLKHNDVDLMLNTAYEKEHKPATKDEARQAAHADTSIYFGCPDTDKLYEYFLNKNINVKPPTKTGYNFMALYVFDPDGYKLVFHWPIKDEN
jgi:glyoxylase I family protein